MLAEVQNVDSIEAVPVAFFLLPLHMCICSLC